MHRYDCMSFKNIDINVADHRLSSSSASFFIVAPFTKEKHYYQTGARNTQKPDQFSLIIYPFICLRNFFFLFFLRGQNYKRNTKQIAKK